MTEIVSELSNSPGGDLVTWPIDSDALVNRLRSRSMGLGEAVAPLLRERRRALRRPIQDTDWEILKPVLEHYDELLITSLASRYDALDQAVAKGHIPFAEIDQYGKICYANPTFIEQVNVALPEGVSDPTGQPFAELFGQRRADIEEVLRKRSSASLRVEVRGQGHVRQLRAEIGPMGDEAGGGGAFAFLLDVGGEEARLEAALEAVLRINSAGTITFANTAAAVIFNTTREDLLDRPATGLFADPADSARNVLEPWLHSDAGCIQDLVLAGTSTPIRMSIQPFFDRPQQQSGILLTFHSIENELATKQLQHLLASKIPPSELIREIMHTVKSVVPYEMATFGVYTSDARHFRTILVDPPPNFRWSTRWFEVQPAVLDWLDEEKTWVEDLNEFMQWAAPDMERNPVAINVKKLNLQSFVTVPVRGAAKYNGALTLLSSKRIYGVKDLDKLKSLDLETILQAAIEALDCQRQEQLRKLKSDLAKATSARQVARRLAEGVSKCFDWEYVGVFQVDRRRNQFVLFAQYPAEGELTVNPSYTQPLSEGMMSHVLQQQSTIIVPDTRDQQSSRDFIFTSPEQASAMATPLKVNGRIELVIDLESIDTNAFQGDDRQELEQLAADCEQIIQHRWQQAITHSLLDASDRAAVVVDAVGTIREMNAHAKQILCVDTDTDLSSLGASSQDKATLRSTNPCDRLSLALLAPGGGGIPTLATQRPLGDDYGHRLWLFTDLREQLWQRDWRYLDATVREVAKQTRTPLLIADSLLREAAGLVTSPKRAKSCVSLIETAATHLGKADLTFERLSSTLMAHQEPTDPPHVFDALGLLRACYDLLPKSDRAAIKMDSITKGDTFLVKGWPGRLEFAFRSLLGNLVLGNVGPLNPEITSARGASGELVLQFRSSMPRSRKTAEQDPISRATSNARVLVQLAPEAVEAIVQQHGGHLNLKKGDALNSEFVMTLPAVKGGAA
ncbi:PAS domain-containing protein [Sinorhizobium meliloti]|uniref:PAS domain-containing protein n=1 Tax=Rhizobium meliloti TaxID=382 RepID=UPI000FD825CB|nr:PAS domain-containing protein [Sinorhizobium meliloti]RVH09636.1 PAS domain-containing protein [Sinorhizobium meliloti]